MKIPVLFNDFPWFVTIIKTQDNTLIKVQRDSYMTTLNLYMDHVSTWDMKVTQIRINLLPELSFLVFFFIRVIVLCSHINSSRDLFRKHKLHRLNPEAQTTQTITKKVSVRRVFRKVYHLLLYNKLTISSWFSRDCRWQHIWPMVYLLPNVFGGVSMIRYLILSN